MAMREYDGHKMPPVFNEEMTPEIQARKEENKKKAMELLERVRERHKEEYEKIGI